MIGYFAFNGFVFASVSVEIGQIGGINDVDYIFIWGHIGGECEGIYLRCTRICADDTIFVGINESGIII